MLKVHLWASAKPTSPIPSDSSKGIITVGDYIVGSNYRMYSQIPYQAQSPINPKPCKP